MFLRELFTTGSNSILMELFKTESEVFFNYTVIVGVLSESFLRESGLLLLDSFEQKSGLSLRESGSFSRELFLTEPGSFLMELFSSVSMV